MTLGSFDFNAQGYVPALLDVCLALELVGSWVELGFSVGMETFACALVNSCSLDSGVFWCSQVLDLSLLPLAFSLILTVALEKAMAPHSSTLAWKIPWTEGLVGCSPWGR